MLSGLIWFREIVIVIVVFLLLSFASVVALLWFPLLGPSHLALSIV